MYEVTGKSETLIYIGSSGQRLKNGELKTRNGGMRDRLINGYHPNKFGEAKRIKRHIALPNQMLKENIKQIRIYWWVTYDEKTKDSPTDVETKLRSEYLKQYNKMPRWHKS